MAPSPGPSQKPRASQLAGPEETRQPAQRLPQGTLVVSAGCELAAIDFPTSRPNEIVNFPSYGPGSFIHFVGKSIARYYWEKKNQILYSLASSLLLSIPCNRLFSELVHNLGGSDGKAYVAGALAGTMGWYLGFYAGRSIEDRYHAQEATNLSIAERLKRATFGVVNGLGILAYATTKIFHFGVTTATLELCWFGSMLTAEAKTAGWLQTPPHETAAIVHPFLSFAFVFATPLICDIVDFSVNTCRRLLAPQSKEH